MWTLQMLENRSLSIASYLLAFSAQDIPTTNFWDEETSDLLSTGSLWPNIIPDTADTAYFSNAWQALIDHLTRV